MRMKHLFVAAVSAAAITAGSAQAQQLGIGTMGQGTSGYSMGSAIAGVLAANGVEALVQPASGTSAYLPLLDSGELDFGIANIIETSQAMAGEGPFDGRQLENLRAVAVLYPFRVGVFVRDDSEIETVADLEGHAVTFGFTSQVTLNRVLTALMATAEVTPEEIDQVLVPNVVAGADQFAAGAADAAFFAMGSGKVTEVDASVGGVRWLPVPDSDEALARMQEIVPEAYIATVEPAPGLTGVDAPIPAMVYDYMLLAGAHVPDETVADVVRILSENREALIESFGPFRGFNPDRMRGQADVNYHDGAEMAFEEMGQ